MKNYFGKSIIPPEEERRIEVLRSYPILDTAPEEVFDNLALTAAEDFEVPLTAISFVDQDHVFIKASVGMPNVNHVERGLSLCAVTILSNQPTIIEDAINDPSFGDHPLVQGDLGLRFYAGAPLTTKEGFNIGTICLIDRSVRKFGPEDVKKLRRYAEIIMHEIEWRREAWLRSRELEEKSFQLKQALTLAKIGTWEYDVLSGNPNWSDELYDIFGLKKSLKGPVLLESYLSMVHPDDFSMVSGNLADPRTTPDEINLRFIRPCGGMLYVHQSARKVHDGKGKLVKISGITRDITEQMIYEEKLQHSEERFRSLVQNSSDMVGIIDTAGNYLYVAESVYHILGYKPDFFKGKNAIDFIHPEDREHVAACLKEIDQKKYLDVPAFRFLNNWGKWTWINTRMANLLHDPAIQGLVVNSRDITEWVELQQLYIKETEKKQKEITAAVIRAQENERAQVGQELHDNVNQVLTTVKLYNEMVAGGIGNQQEILAKSQYFLQCCIDEIRSISKRLSAPTLGEIKLEDSIRELVKSINITNKMELAYSIEGLQPAPLHEELHLAVYRIIQEQLNNILKHAEASYTVVNLYFGDNFLLLTITDNGKGFDVGAKRSGIGITNMRTRAENLNGIFEMISAPGKGCQLKVRFPLD